MVVLIFILVGLIGCDSEKGGNVGKLDPDKAYTVTVMDDKDFFMNRFGKLLLAKYPNLTFRFVQPPVPENKEDRIGAMVKFLQQHKPDLLYLSFDMYKALSARQVLLDLNPLVKSEKYDLESFHPGVIERLRDGDPDHLYGLSPTFFKKGLYYNIDLFEKHRVRLPTDKMTWEDAAELARMFPLKRTDNDPLVGIYVDDLFGNDDNLYVDRMFEIGAIERLPILNREGTALQMEDRRWKAIWTFLQTNFRSGVLEKAAQTENKRDLFIDGQAAMAYAPNVYSQLLERNMKNRWGVVTEPVGPDRKEYSYSISLREVFAVSSGTPVAPIVWELMKFIHSDEVMQLQAQSSGQSHLLFSRESVPMSRGKIDYSSFYKLKHWLAPVGEKTTDEYIKAFSELAEQELTKAIEAGKQVDQALKDLQESGQTALTR
ncbi:MAG: extracellular solute-binding protein [Paenibacillus sp.]|jgi:multiple sugar transport system substrate-binding protein|nr:extracellular solute-binding protein [Paenibacillus sp.]